MNIQLKYDIVFRTPYGEINSDVQFLTFVRSPLIKVSSFALMKINLTQTLTQQIINDLANNLFSDYSLEIYTVDESKSDIKVEKLFNKPYKILYIEPTEPISFEKQNISSYMSTTNTYNTILENVTAYQAIKKYEEFIKKQYGDIFKFKDITSNFELNKFKYEQILVKTKSDLDVPLYLINTYKPFNSFCFYFFDDFNLDEDSDNEITCHFINLFDKEKIRKYDITKYSDILGTTKRLDIFPLSDPTLKLDKMDQTLNISNREIIYNTIKKTKSKVPKKNSNSDVKTSKILDEREVKIGNFTNPIKMTDVSSSSQHTNIYSPDTTENAINRFEILREFFLKHIDHIQTFETTDCLPDWCKFGKLYNMGNMGETEYLYTPLCIFNIFVRINAKESFCKHLSRYSMLKYLDDDVEHSYFNVLKDTTV